MPRSPVVAAPPVVTHRYCRVCAADAPVGKAITLPPLEPLLNLGACDLVGFPTRPGGLTSPPVPIDIRGCPRCSLVQLAHTAPPEWRYGEYWYRSATNETMVAELGTVVDAVRRRGAGVDARDVVVDIGANDGTLLAAWAQTGGPVPFRVAFEPASNLHADVSGHAEVVYQTLFPHPSRTETEHLAGRVSVVTAIAVAYAQDDPQDFFREIARLLAPDGWAVVQFQDLARVLAETQIDYFCHEHLVAWSAYSLMQTLQTVGLALVDVEMRAINGGSLRCYIRHRNYQHSRTRAALEGFVRVQAQVLAEETAGVFRAGVGLPVWQAFASRVQAMRTVVHTAVAETVGAGGTVDLYGASTKGSLLLQVCGLDHGLIRQAWERSLQKIGRYVGNTAIPIVSEARGRRMSPTLLLTGIWQFREAVIAREIAYLRAGGTMLFPLPSPELVWFEAEDVRMRGVA
jgi:NDP-4-keto-2,6-dideoxyhexose 3-C-methyltransferase